MKFTKLKKNKYLAFFKMQKCKKNPQKTHFGNIGISNLRFFSIALKFGPQVHNDFLVTNAIAKLKKNQKTKKLFNYVLK